MTVVDWRADITQHVLCFCSKRLEVMLGRRLGHWVPPAHDGNRACNWQIFESKTKLSDLQRIFNTFSCLVWVWSAWHAIEQPKRLRQCG